MLTYWCNHVPGISNVHMNMQWPTYSNELIHGIFIGSLINCSTYWLTQRLIYMTNHWSIDSLTPPLALSVVHKFTGLLVHPLVHTRLAKKVVTPPLKTIKPMWIELLCFHLAEIGMIWTRDCFPTKSNTTLGRHSMQGQVGSSSSETTV